MLNNTLQIKDLPSVDFCCCAGGASYGTEQAGFRVALGVDIDKRALAWHQANFINTPLIEKAIGDVSTEEILQITGLKVGELPHLHCSWPCQENSTNNTKTAANPPENINRVFFDFYEKIKALQPMVFTGENVDGALMGKKKKYFNQIIQALKALPNYTFNYKLLNSVNYLVPQNRRRLIIIGKKNDVTPNISVASLFPEPDYEKAKRLTLDYVLPYVQKYRSGQFQNKEIPAFNHYMCTMCSNNSVEVLVNGKWRKLTVEEVKLIMGFPKEFLLPDSVTLAMALLGNAVPPPMMEAIMTRIKSLVFDGMMVTPSDNIILPIAVTDGVPAEKPGDNNEPATEIIHPSPKSAGTIQVSKFKHQKRIISSEELLSMEFDTLGFTGKWHTFFGNPSTLFNAIIHGMAGEGKSTMAVQFAKYLADNHGKTLYISGEEGFSKTLKDKVLLTDSSSNTLHWAELKSSLEILREVRTDAYSFIFIDSLQHLNIGAPQMRELRAKYKNTAFICISQATKAGEMRGSNELAHDSDIIVKVEKGLATTTKNRFKEKGTTFNVFECIIPTEEELAENKSGAENQTDNNSN